jgi:hypothetical protein
MLARPAALFRIGQPSATLPGQKESPGHPVARFGRHVRTEDHFYLYGRFPSQELDKMNQSVCIPEDAKLGRRVTAGGMLATNQDCHAINQAVISAESVQDLPCNWRPFYFLPVSGTGPVNALSLGDADVMQIGCGQGQNGISLDKAEHLFGVGRNLERMLNTPLVSSEIVFHGRTDAIEKFFLIRRDRFQNLQEIRIHHDLL